MPKANVRRSSIAGTAVEWFEKGQQLLRQRRVDEALVSFDTAQEFGFPINECAAARWNCWMLLGKFELAWRESELICESGVPDPHRFWDGRSWSGRRVMLRCLHGLGDTLQFIRYAPLLRQSCAALTVQTHPQLTTLLEGVSAIDRVITWGREYEEDSGDWDMQMEVTELPRTFRTTVESLPATVPYIHVPHERVDWAAREFVDRDRIRVGLCWQSGPWDLSRSVSLDDFSILFATSTCQFFNLQKGADPKEIQRRWPLQELEGYASDVRDTAALVMNLDLVITVDTIIAHLAGALGRPVWILLPFSADWRWMLDTTETPWYPTARLFRQPYAGDWKSVIAGVAYALSNYSLSSFMNQGWNLRWKHGNLTGLSCRA